MRENNRSAEEELQLPLSYVTPTLIAWILLANLMGLILMGADKSRARHGAWRIPEKTFFVLALLGGSIGCWSGMYLFHHKTKHWYFVVGMPLILAGQVLCVWWLKTHIL